ncbi:MAG: 4-phosphoerythronate dehydrogenase [Paludibacteraceae bacterium]|nr:4-phosphoerythronate dehydrogenase [Paludibacteraceae bacterium]
MKVVADRNIPYVKGFLEPWFDVQYIDQTDFTPEVVRDADALLIRTRTRCNETLLRGSRVQFIATATIGFDQIDTDYCAKNGIAWTNSPGCNAQGVCDYVESALERFDGRRSKVEGQKILGVVGVGHVGRLVAEMAKRRGYNVLLCDPPRAEKEGPAGFVSLEEIEAKCDIITFHVPLIREGKHPTWHMETCTHLKPNTLLINAARGGVIDEQALLKAGNPCVIDTWENEPHANKTLIEHALLATYHIAGYTRRGKYNASQMVVDALFEHFGLPRQILPGKPEDAPRIWDIDAVSNQLKAHPENFETLRETYQLR